jgi:hypothetical protein
MAAMASPKPLHIRLTLSLRQLGATLALSSLLACGSGSAGDTPPAGSPAPASPPASAASASVSTRVSGLGTVSPSSASVAAGGSASFTVTAADGYQVSAVTGCGGSLSGSTYTTGAITAACTVVATFGTSGGTGTTSNTWPSTQSSDKAALWGFDFVEEFDGLQDWNQSSCLESNGLQCGNQWDSVHPERLPHLANGTPSPWGYFSAWNTVTVDAPWIGSETASGRKVWRGTKSATLDLGPGNKGPSRLGLFMGKGYTHWSAFYMLWMPKNSFPTSCEGGSCGGGGPLGTYTEGQPYTYFASYKLHSFNMKCLSSHCPNSNTYGLQDSLTMIKQRNYTPVGLSFVHYNGVDHKIDYATDGGNSLDIMMGTWFGVEFNIENISNAEYRVNMWVYDQRGNAIQMMRDKIHTIAPEAQGGTWDQFFFGGNNANSWTWGPTMSSHYYVDDLIIDNGSKGRIGPRYFRAIGVVPN